VIIAVSADKLALSPAAEARIGSLADLVAAAVSNADILAELMASRARVVAGADKPAARSNATCTTAPSSAWCPSRWRREPRSRPSRQRTQAQPS
jgi:hypothetical protein